MTWRPGPMPRPPKPAGEWPQARPASNWAPRKVNWSTSPGSALASKSLARSTSSASVIGMRCVPPPLRWGITRSDTDAFGLASRQRSARALDEARFAGQPIPIDVPDRGPDGQALGTSTVFARDEAPRASTLEGLAALKPTGRPD